MIIPLLLRNGQEYKNNVSQIFIGPVFEKLQTNTGPSAFFLLRACKRSKHTQDFFTCF